MVRLLVLPSSPYTLETLGVLPCAGQGSSEISMAYPNSTPMNDDEGPWDVLPHILTEPGIRAGTATTHKMGFGPYWRLRAGAYRLSIDADTSRATERSRYPMLGVDVIAQDRFRLAWKEFDHAALSKSAVIEFTVPKELSASEVAAPIEFILLNLGVGSVKLRSMTLSRARPAQAQAAQSWNLLGCLRTRGLGHFFALQRTDAMEVRRLCPVAAIFHCRPRPRLQTGLYEIRLRGQPRVLLGGHPLDIQVVASGYGELLRTAVTASALLDGAAFVFEVPESIALESGVPAPIDVIIHNRNLGGWRLEALQIVGPLTARSRQEPVPTSRRGQHMARRKLVVIGNCQAGTIASAINGSPRLAAKLQAIYHHPALQTNLLERGRQELAQADTVLVQDISDLQSYPLAFELGERVQLHFPCIRFSSLWPFDGHIGATDRVAHDREAPDFTFVGLDSMLGKLRREIPDPELRFEAYRHIAQRPGLVDLNKLHNFERRRLAKMDADYAMAIGEFILERFRRQRLFYSCGHPSAVLFKQLISSILEKLEEPASPTWTRLDHLGRDQVPVHPWVAETLGVTWAHDQALYTHRGGRVTWEGYVRDYIHHYG